MPAVERPLRIVIGCDTFAPDVNGAAKFATRLAAGLSQRGHEVHVVAPSPDRHYSTRVEEHEGGRFTVHRLRSIGYPKHEWLRVADPWRILPNAGSLLDALKPDVVHFQSHFVVGRGMAAAAKARGIRLIATNHTMFENLMDHSLVPKGLQPAATSFAWHDAASVLRKADEVTTPTRRSAEYLEKKTGLRGVHAISCGLRASDYRPKFGPRDRNRIVFVGRVTSEKRIDVLIRALALLPKELDATLEIIGQGDLVGELRQLAESLGVGDRVTLTGYVTDEQLRATLTNASLFAIASEAELQSIATLEAMASGLPIVAARAMALPHLVHDGENGWLFPAGDAHAAADRIQRVLELAPADYERMQRRSIAYVGPHDIDTTLATFEALYRGHDVVDPVTEIDIAASGPVPPLAARDGDDESSQ